MKPDGSSVLEADTLFVPRKQRVRHCQGRKINLDFPLNVTCRLSRHLPGYLPNKTAL